MAALEILLLKASNGDGNELEFPIEITSLYAREVDLPRLKIQLQMLPVLMRT